MISNDERTRINHLATAAWRRLKRERKVWGDWLIVGEALSLWRNEAMQQAGVNKPSGKGYNMAFGIMLQENKLDDMDKTVRGRLLQCMDNLTLIELWRNVLTLPERMELNHPTTVWRAWKRSLAPEIDKPKKPTVRDEVIRLEEENYQLKARIVELEEELASARERVPG